MRSTTTFPLAIVILLFCFGLFESIALSQNLLPIHSPLLLLLLFAMAICIAFASRCLPSETRIPLTTAFLLACIVLNILLALAGIVRNTLSPVLYIAFYMLTMGIHLFIWACCIRAHAQGGLDIVFAVCAIFFVIMLSHRLGWLITSNILASQPAHALAICSGVSLAGLAIAFALIAFSSVGYARKLEDFFFAEDAKEQTDFAPEHSPYGHAAFSAAAQAFFEENKLTQRQAEVLALYCRGRSISYIAQTLCISENTVKTHLRHCYQRLGVANRQELINKVEAFGGSK